MRRKIPFWVTWGCLSSVFFITMGYPVRVLGTEILTMEECLQKRLLQAPDNMTVGKMRDLCRAEIEGVEKEVAAGDAEGVNAIEKRIRIDRENVLKPFTIMSHRQNYFLLAAHNFAGYSEDEYVEFTDDSDALPDDTETHFQLSIKTPLAVGLFDLDLDLYAAYTVRSFWQIYNSDNSSPFRETNHEPEFWLQTHPDIGILGFNNVATAFGIVHQSNGRSSNLSRSWNRVYANLIFQRGNLAISLKPWLRIQEDREDDDNPDISDFMGHFELRMAYKYDDHTFTMMSRNNLESNFTRGALELGWSFPLFNYPYLRGYVQYFTGYGESLIDYDRYVNRLGVGLLLSDLL